MADSQVCWVVPARQAIQVSRLFQAIRARRGAPAVREFLVALGFRVCLGWPEGLEFQGRRATAARASRGIRANPEHRAILAVPAARASLDVLEVLAVESRGSKALEMLSSGKIHD